MSDVCRVANSMPVLGEKMRSVLERGTTHYTYYTYILHLFWWIS